MSPGFFHQKNIEWNNRVKHGSFFFIIELFLFIFTLVMFGQLLANKLNYFFARGIFFLYIWYNFPRLAIRAQESPNVHRTELCTWRFGRLTVLTILLCQFIFATLSRKGFQFIFALATNVLLKCCCGACLEEEMEKACALYFYFDYFCNFYI